MAAIKILVNGVAGAGKTSSLEGFGNETLVISRDAKLFNLRIPHMIVDKYYDMTTMLYGGKVVENGVEIEVAGVANKVREYTDKMGKVPKNVAIDSVSQIWMDVIDKASLSPNKYGSQGAEVTKEMGIFVKFIHEYLELNGVNIILLNHVIEEKSEGVPTGVLVPFGQGKFKEKGGFFSTVNEAVTIEVSGGHRLVHTNNLNKMARTTLTDVPVKMWMRNTVDDLKSKKLKEGEKYFNLKEYMEMLIENQAAVDEFRL